MYRQLCLLSQHFGLLSLARTPRRITDLRKTRPPIEVISVLTYVPTRLPNIPSFHLPYFLFVHVSVRSLFHLDIS